MNFLYFQGLSLKIIEMLSFFQLTPSLLVKCGSLCIDVREGGDKVHIISFKNLRKISRYYFQYTNKENVAVKG